MGTTTTSIEQVLRPRCRAIAANCRRAIAPAKGGNAGQPASEQELAALIEQAVDLLLRPPVDASAAQKLGGALARACACRVNALAVLTHALAQNLTAGLPPEQAARLQPGLVALLGGITIGFWARAEPDGAEELPRPLQPDALQTGTLDMNDAIPCYTWQHIDGNFVLVGHNRAAEAITRRQIKKFLGWKLTDLHQNTPDIVADIMRAFAKQTTIRRQMNYHFQSTGQERYLDVNYAYCPPDLVLVQTEDITERKQTEFERERLLNTEREQRLLAETLRDVTLALTSKTGFEAVLDEILRQAQHLVPCATLNISLLKGNTLQVARWQGYQNLNLGEMIGGLVQSLDEYHVDREALETRRPLIIPDTAQEPRWIHTTETAFIKSYLTVPICIYDRALGVLRLDGDAPHRFCAADGERLLPLAHAAAIALENARLYEQARQELAERRQAEAEVRELNRKLVTVQYAGATIASSLDLQLVLNTVAREMVESLEVAGCAIYKWDPVAESVFLITAHGPSIAEHRTPQGYRLDDFPPAKEVLCQRRPRQITAGQVDATIQTIAPFHFNSVQSILLLPMEFQDRVIGLAEVTRVQNTRPFTIPEIALIQLLANQAAGAIENARLYQRAQQEIIERKQAEQKLRRSEARHKTLLAAIPDLIFRLTLDGVFIDYRAHHNDELYLPPEQFLGKAVPEVMPPDVAGLIETHLDRLRQTRRMQHFEYRLPMAGEAQDYEARLILGSDNNVLAIVRNVTQRKRAVEQVIRAEQLAALGRLSATLAHEINNPLQAVQSHLDLVLDFPLEPGERDKYLGIIRQEFEQLNNMTKYVLNLARPQVAPRRPVSPVELVRQVLALVDRQLKEAGFTVTTDLYPVPEVWAAPEQLTHIFLNLVTNAIESGGETPAPRHLNVVVYPEQDDAVAVSFTNNGPPIPQEILPRLFEPFFTTKPQGSGLGLWMSYNLIQQHGGELSVENLENDGGVIFTVKLPVTHTPPPS
ncbi:MAG: GAF domain-containing protein [Anaerolineae bacterium]